MGLPTQIVMARSTGAVVTPFLDLNPNDYADTAAAQVSAFRSVPEDTGAPPDQWGQQSIIGSSPNKYLRMTMPDRTGDGNRCADYYIVWRRLFPSLKTAVWCEVPIIFSSNFSTDAPAGWGCGSNADWKGLFLEIDGVNSGGTPSPSALRTSLKYDTYALTGANRYWDATAPGQGDGDAPPTGGLFTGPNWSDGSLHTIRFHVQVPSAYASNDGVYKVWLDGSLVYAKTDLSMNTGTLTAAQIRGFRFGNNRNKGPDQSMTVDFGRTRFYDVNPGW